MALREKKIYPKWEATIVGANLVFKDQQGFEKHLGPMEGKTMHVIVKDIAKDRSRQEEKYYHAVVVRMVAEAMDIADQEAHELLKKMFLTVEEKTSTGFRFRRVLSTTDLSDKAYRNYWENIIRWAAQPTDDEGLGPSSGLGLSIPYPNEMDYDHF